MLIKITHYFYQTLVGIISQNLFKSLYFFKSGEMLTDVMFEVSTKTNMARKQKNFSNNSSSQVEV
jgi:hypothetical protein